MSADSTLNQPLDLGPARIEAQAGLFSSFPTPDAMMARLFSLPDTMGDMIMTYSPTTPMSGVLAAVLPDCSAAHRGAASWFGDIRPRAVATIQAVTQSASDLSASYGTLAALLAKLEAGPDPEAKSQAFTILDKLKTAAANESEACSALARDLAALDERVRGSVARLAAADQGLNLWHISEEADQRQLDQGLLSSVSLGLERLDGAWAALSDDLGAAATAISQDIEGVPGVIAGYGLQEAALQWQHLAERVAQMSIPPWFPFSEFRAFRNLGWYQIQVDDGNSMQMDLSLQTSPGGGVGMGTSNGQTLQAERLGGDQCGYYRFRFSDTGKYLGAENASTGADARLAQTDWTDGDHQKWRPVLANQSPLPAVDTRLISGWFLVQHGTGMAAAVDLSTFPPPAQDSLLSLKQVAVPIVLGQLRAGLSVFQTRNI